MRLAIQFHRRIAVSSHGASPISEPVGSVVSSARFQTRHARADLALRAARRWPTASPGRYPVDLAFTDDGLPRLEARVGRERVAQVYPSEALRGEEVLDRLLVRFPALEKDDLHYVATLAGHAADAAASAADPPPSRRAFLVAGESDEVLEIDVRGYHALPVPVSLEDLAQYGPTRSGDIPALVPESLLRALAEDEATRAGQPFVERAWYLVGRVVRNGSAGDLIVVVDEALPAEHTAATAAAVVLSEHTKAAVTEALSADSAAHRRLVGWVHTHGRLDEEEDRNLPRDRRFFSTFDARLHRKDFGPDAIALVLDADAAVADPRLVGRVFGCFGTALGVVVRRGFRTTPDQKGEGQ